MVDLPRMFWEELKGKTPSQCPTYTLENIDGLLSFVCSSDLQHHTERKGCYRLNINFFCVETQISGHAH